jgi:ribose transport system permease protein
MREHNLPEQKSIIGMVFSKSNVVLISTIVIFVLFSVFADGFLSTRNIVSILRSMSIIAVIAFGLTFILTMGEIDLSIVSVPAFAGCMIPFLLNEGLNPFLIILIALIAGLCVGILSGLIISFTDLPGIIITMAISMIVSGVTYIISDQTTKVVSNQQILSVIGGSWGLFPLMAVWMIVFLFLSYFILHKTKFGRNISFVGENKNAAYFSGIKIKTAYIITFGLAGLYSAAGGILGVGLASNASPMMISNSMMTVIAAVVLGGTSLTGGKGNIFSTLLGAFFLTLISNGFLILGIEQWVVYLVNGITIIGVLIMHYLDGGSLFRKNMKTLVFKQKYDGIPSTHRGQNQRSSN